MTHKDFNRLTTAQRHSLLTKEGVYLAARNQGTYMVYLFRLGEHYVELYLHAATRQTMWIEIQNNDAVLNDYLSKISLNDLFS